MMSTRKRQPLSTLSTNALHSANSVLKSNSFNIRIEKPPLTKAASFPSISTSSRLEPHSKGKSSISNADKLKYRLKLAYYKLRTNQTKVPASEIISKPDFDSSSINRPNSATPTSKKIASLASSKETPSSTRHISLLDASTPFNSSTDSEAKKRVSFTKGTISKLQSKTSNQLFDHLIVNPKITEFHAFVPPASIRSFSFPIPNTTTLKFVNTVKRSNLTAASTSKDSKSASSIEEGHYRRHSLKIDDLCNESINNSTILQDETDADATINEANSSNATVDRNDTVEGDITPVKRRAVIGKDHLGSSPAKAYMSTPGSYKAAKSLLELGLMN